MKPFVAVAGLLLLLACAVCLGAVLFTKETTGSCLRDQYVAMEGNIPALEQKAKSGGGDVAFALARYYAYVKEDFQHAAYWEKTSAEEGYLDAMKSYGESLSQDADPKRKEEGLLWLEKARTAYEGVDEQYRKRIQNQKSDRDQQGSQKAK